MKRTNIISVLVVLMVLMAVLLFSSCGSSGPGGGRGASSFNMNVGTGTSYNIREYFGQLIIAKYNYELENERFTATNIYYETKWKERALFDDEHEAGFNNVRTRIIVEAIARTRAGLTGSALFSIRFQGEYMVKVADEEGWIHINMSDEARNEFRTIARDLEVQLRSGFRKF